MFSWFKNKTPNVLYEGYTPDVKSQPMSEELGTNDVIPNKQYVCSSKIMTTDIVKKDGGTWYTHEHIYHFWYVDGKRTVEIKSSDASVSHAIKHPFYLEHVYLWLNEVYTDQKLKDEIYKYNDDN